MTKNEDETKARIKGGIDPLTDGTRLYNDSNSSDSKTYRVDRTELDAPKRKKHYQMIEAVKTDNTDKPGIPDREPHKSKNPDKEAQLKVAKGRKE